MRLKHELSKTYDFKYDRCDQLFLIIYQIYLQKSVSNLCFFIFRSEFTALEYSEAC